MSAPVVIEPDEIVIVEGNSLDTLRKGYENDHVSIRRRRDLVHIEVGNGGDFGSTEWWLTPQRARELAEAILRQCK